MLSRDSCLKDLSTQKNMFHFLMPGPGQSGPSDSQGPFLLPCVPVSDVMSGFQAVLHNVTSFREFTDGGSLLPFCSLSPSLGVPPAKRCLSDTVQSRTFELPPSFQRARSNDLVATGALP